MKTLSKITLFAPVCLALALVFSSCSAIGGYSEPEDSLVAMAVGFDRDGDMIRVSLQLSSGGEGYRTAVGEGETIEDALFSILSSESKSAEFSHVGVIALGRGLDGNDVDKILNFLQDHEEISLSARLVSTSDASQLLSADGFGGYEMVAMLSNGVGAPLSAESRIYLSYMSAALAIPYFASNGGGFELYGIRVFRDGEGLFILGRDEAEIYLMMKNTLVGGRFGDSKTIYTLKKTDGGCVLTVTAHLPLQSRSTLTAISEKMRGLYTEIYERHGDVFGYAERVRALGGAESFLVEFECKERDK